MSMRDIFLAVLGVILLLDAPSISARGAEIEGKSDVLRIFGLI